MGDLIVLEAIAIVLFLLWALGFVSSVTMGGGIHALLILVIIVVLFRVFKWGKLL